MSVLLTRGLASAVLATLPLQYADPVKYPDVGRIFQELSPVYINIAIVVILATAVIATVGIPLLRWKSRKRQLRHVSETQRVGTRKKGSLQDRISP
jgi:hypothetical protein